MKTVLLSFAVSLLLTLLLEVPPGLWSTRKGEFRTRLEVFVLANVLTNPAVVGLVLLAETYAPSMRIPAIAFGEVMAVLAEYCVFRIFQEELACKRPFLLSLGLNLWSYSAGLLLSLLL